MKTLLPSLFTILLCCFNMPCRAALSPLAFDSTGTLNLTNGNYFINTSGPVPEWFDASSNVIAAGVLYDQDIPSGSNYWGFDSVVAVFDFNSVYIGGNVTNTAMGTNPVVVLSRGSMTLDGLFDASGTNGENGTGDIGGTSFGYGGQGGPGGGNGGDGGADKGDDGQGPGGQGGGSGAYGGTSGNGSRGNGAGFGGQGGGGFGGLVYYSTYGDLTQYLQGGAGGGGTGQDAFLSKGAGGGGGGGGVEMGALNTIYFGGQIYANGGNGGGGATVLAGGGSGGGVILDAPVIDLTTNTAAVYADGGSPNGGGGRILVLTDSGQSLDGTFAVDPGASGGATGVAQFAVLSMGPSPLLTITPVDGFSEVEICWASASNVIYQLETNSSLSSSNWGAIGSSIVGNGSTNCVTYSISNVPAEFYRLEVAP